MRADWLIKEVRRRTISGGATTTSGISDFNFLSYLNEAVYRLEGLINEVQPTYFEEQYVFDVIGRQRAYALPADAALGRRIGLVEYSWSGLDKDYSPLERIQLVEADVVEVTYPSKYAISAKELILSPLPQANTGKVRITYAKEILALDLRRGAILSDTDSTIVLSAAPTGDNLEALQSTDYICIVDAFGVVQHDALPITGISSATISGTFTGLSITAGHFVVAGEYASSHLDSRFPRKAKQYVQAWASRRILGTEESSTDIAAEDPVLSILEQGILDDVRSTNDDIVKIPVINRYYQ